MWAAYLTALLGVLAAQASPGPNMMAVAGVALGQGRRHAIIVATGIASGALLWAAAAALGLAQLLARFPLSLMALQFVGGGYLVFLGVKGVMAALRGGTGSVRVQRKNLSVFGAWRRGFMVILTNPKAALMWSALASFLFGAGLEDLQVLVFGVVAAATALLIYGAYGFMFSSRAAISVYQRVTRPIEAAMGAAFGLMGAALVWSGLKSLRG